MLIEFFFPKLVDLLFLLIVLFGLALNWSEKREVPTPSSGFRELCREGL